ncbi:MAG: pyridoxal phosphate-dependent aminotransferase [Chlamydiota bacterium]|nr:pyridoxal phosphate-dependent aminotransferase [Chlamydiota bacterium]
MKNKILFILATIFALQIEAAPYFSAQRTEQPIPMIRQILRKVPTINKVRQEFGLEPVISLGIGQPHIPMNNRVIENLISTLEDYLKLPPEEQAAFTGYTLSAGTEKTRNSIRDLFNASYPKVSFEAEEVMVANGAAGAMSNALHSFVEQGTKVAAIAPYFGAYQNQIDVCQGSLIPCVRKPGDSPAQALKNNLDETIKVFIWNDPNNPLGNKATREELEDVATVLRKYPNLIIIHDEVYRDLIHARKEPALLDIAPDLLDRSIVIRSISKDIAGAPGLRAGMAATKMVAKTPSGMEKPVIELMANYQLQDIASISIITQELLCLAIHDYLSGYSDEWSNHAIEEYTNNAKKLSEGLEKIGLKIYSKANSAFYVCVDCSNLIGKKIPDRVDFPGLHTRIGSDTIRDDIDIAYYLLWSVGVATVPLQGFGLDPNEATGLRLSCAVTEKQIDEALKRIELALEKLF